MRNNSINYYQPLTTVKNLLFLLCLISSFTQIFAVPNFSASKKYRIVCPLYPDGCVIQGSTANQQTPVYYNPTSSTAKATYWIFTEVKSGKYSIQNSSTGKYITYDDVRLEEYKRYIDMTDAMSGDNSLWTVSLQQNGNYTIRNVAQTDHIWDVRSGSYIVGTYSQPGAGGSNEVFSFYDESGNQVTEATVKDEPTPIPTAGFDVSSWMDGTTNSLEGWNLTGFFLNTGAGGSHINGSASVVAPFIEYWTGNKTLNDSYLNQTVSNIPNGIYGLTAAMISCWQYDNDQTVATGVKLYLNDASTATATKNNVPLNYSLTSNVTEGKATLGIDISKTNTNWVAIDNVVLRYLGTSAQLIAGEETKIITEGIGKMTVNQLKTQISTIKNSASDTISMFSALESFRASLKYLPSTDPLSTVIDSLTFGEHSMVYDQLNNYYMYSMPQDYMDSDFTCTINYKKGSNCSNLFIDEVEVESGSTYTFNGITAGKTYSLHVTDESGTTISSTLTFTTLPIVQIYGSFGDIYSAGKLRVYQPTKKEPELLNAKMKWRGGITDGSDKHKRNYSISIQDELGNKLDQKFFGLRKDNKWILEACQVDMSRVRNRTITDLWNDFSHKPYYYAQEPQALTGTRGQFVETFLNDKYVGVYCMTECIDRKQMKLVDYDSIAQVQHGMLWKSKDWSYSVFMGHNSDNTYYPMVSPTSFNNNSESWDQYFVQYPDIDDVNPTDFSTLYNAVDLISSGTDALVTKEFCNYFDYPLLMDYYILMETILSTDNHGKNMFFAVYDKAVDKKVTFSVWDMDATMGQRWSDYFYHSSIMSPEQDYTSYIINSEHGDYNLFRRLKNLNINNFNDSVRYRYRNLRKTYLSTDSIIARYTKYINLLKISGAATRESARWNGDSDIAGLSLNFDTELDFLKDWITKRMNYLDKTRFKIAELPEDPIPNGIITPRSATTINSYGSSIIITTDKSGKITIYNIAGQVVKNVNLSEGVNEVNGLPSGVYIINNQRVVVGK